MPQDHLDCTDVSEIGERKHQYKNQLNDPREKEN